MRIVHNAFIEGILYEEVFVSRHANERLQQYGISQGLFANVIRGGSLTLVSKTSKILQLAHDCFEIVFDRFTKTVVTVVIHASNKLYAPKPKIKDKMPDQLKVKASPEVEIQVVTKVQDFTQDRTHGIERFKRLFEAKKNPRK